MSRVVKKTLAMATVVGIAAVLYAAVGKPRDTEWFVFFGLMIMLFGLINWSRWRRSQPAQIRPTPDSP